MWPGIPLLIAPEQLTSHAATVCTCLHEHARAASALQFLRSHAPQPANGAHVWLLGTHQCCYRIIHEPYKKSQGDGSLLSKEEL